MDVAAKDAFARLNARLDVFEKDRWEPTTRRTRELEEKVDRLVRRVEQLEGDRWEPTTRRVREIHEKVV